MLIIMAIDEVVISILLLQNLQGIWCDNILILNQLIRQMKPLSQQNHNFVIIYYQGFPSMTNDEEFFPSKFLKRIHGLVSHLKQTLCCMLEMIQTIKIQKP